MLVGRPGTVGVHALGEGDAPLERSVLKLEVVVGARARRARTRTFSGHDQRALAQDDVHALGIHAGELDDDVELEWVLGAEDVHSGAETSPRVDEVGYAPEIVEELGQLLLQTPQVARLVHVR